MRMKSKARFLLQMLGFLFVWANGPAMSQTPPAARAKATTAKTDTCSFVPASADGKEQICVRVGAKAATSPKAKAPAPITASTTARKLAPAQSGAPAKPSMASGAVKNPGVGLALKSATELKAPPVTKAVELAANAASPVVAARSAAPAATTAAATVAPMVRVAPVAPVAVAPALVARPPSPATTAAAPAAMPVPEPMAALAVAAPTTAATATATATAGATHKAAPGTRKLRSEDAARRYTDGQELERKGEPQAAMLAYLDAAESGNGLAQKRLGDIYGTGTAYAERDYGLALKWYERARAQGVEIPKPFTFSGLRQ